MAKGAIKDIIVTNVAILYFKDGAL